jgi:SAM-dependent methyltransferase
LLPERLRPRTISFRSLLAGLALGVAVFAAGGLLSAQGGGVRAGAGVGATLLVSLAAGMWAGAPGARSASPAWRWLGAAVALGLAAAFATAWGGEPLRHGATARAVALLVMVGIPAYALGHLVPALVAWREAEAEAHHGDASAEGAGFGPAGVVAVGIVVGMALGAAAGGLALFPRFAEGPVLAVVAVLVGLPFYVPSSEGEAGGETTLFETETPYGAVRVTELSFAARRQPERRLYLNDEIESGELVRTGAPTFAYISAAEKWLGEVAGRGESYLFLGGGAYTLPRRVAERDAGARITVVELDPEVTRAAYRWFGLRTEHGIAALHGDARSVAGALPDESFDRVFVDVYDGSESIPYSLVTRESWESIARLLRPGGTVLANVIGVADGEGDLRFWSTVRTFAEVFPAPRLYSHLDRAYPDRQNFLLAAALPADRALPEKAGLFAPWPRAEWSSPPGTVVYRDTTLTAMPAERPRRDRTARRVE